MSQSNGKGEKTATIAMRPALQDALERQQAVLRALEGPMKDKHEVARWKDDVVRAAMGRLSDGMRALLADPETAVLMEPYFVEATDEAEEFRRIFREALGVEFAFPLEDLSRIAHEEMRTPGVATAAMTQRYGTTEFR